MDEAKTISKTIKLHFHSLTMLMKWEPSLDQATHGPLTVFASLQITGVSSFKIAGRMHHCLELSGHQMALSRSYHCVL